MNTQSNKSNKKVLFICCGQKWYTRNEYIIELLNEQYDTDIIASNKKTYLLRIIKVLYKFFFTKNKKKYDFIYVGFLAQALIPFVKLLYSGPITGDFFLSIYDTLCNDRKKINPKSIFGKIIYKYEKWILNMVNLVIVDCYASKKYFEKTFNCNKEKISVIYVLANKKLFYPMEDRGSQNKNLRVFFYGSCQPLHGVDTILKAAKLLENKKILFTMIGPIKKSYRDLVKKLNLSNVKFINWVKYNKLPYYIAHADICLGGHFGKTEKAKRVIAGKTFQFASMKKAFILGDNEANNELFKNKKNCLMVKMHDEHSLAEAIKLLKNNRQLKEEISQNAREAVVNIKLIHPTK